MRRFGRVRKFTSLDKSAVNRYSSVSYRTIGNLQDYRELFKFCQEQLKKICQEK